MTGDTLTRTDVRRAYSQHALARVCTLPEREFGSVYGMQTVPVEQRFPVYSAPADYYHYRDNGSRVLAVAHLDTVVNPEHRTPYFRGTKNGPLVTSGALDDRLGAYVIVDLLPALGVTCDWLFTVGEESGQSTAGLFENPPGKDYDWVIEFDRKGTDVVMYQYEDDACCQAVQAAGTVTGKGSYSDIACLEHLGVKAFNWGVGYRGNYHSRKGYAYLNDTFAMVAKYLRFHEQNAGITMPHEPGDYSSDGYDCDFCGAENTVDVTTWYCRKCASCQDCGMAQDDGCMCYFPERISGMT